ncbi:MAG TPA: histidine kinase [Steroidobacteraceae bacterium]|nr:histidine kinase [Steroidobacteraceae bacterium]
MATASRMRAALRELDPGHSLMAGTVWLIIVLAASFSLAASVWVGSLARDNIVQQHVRRLSLETDQLGSDLAQAIASRLGAIRAAAAIVRAAKMSGRPSGLREVFDELESAYPELDWIAAADPAGTVVAASTSLPAATSVADRPWFSQGLGGPWTGVIEETRIARGAAAPSAVPIEPGLGDVAAPVRDANGAVVGVVAAHLRWRWAPNQLQRLTGGPAARDFAQALVLDRSGIVLIGPDALRGRPWNGIVADDGSPLGPAPAPGAPGPPRFERLPDGATVLVARSPVSLGRDLAPLGWQLQLSEPRAQVYQRADALSIRILAVSMGLGALTALLGALGARHLTNRLRHLARSVAAVGRNETTRIDVPGGHDEVAQLAVAFARILDDLQQERGELRALSSDLERRVAVRTREVERLAEESRYAAVVRERLKIARDLHDTLAHSMMAMLSEIRLLRRLQARDPQSVAEELARAEQVAHEGLKEARIAIAQMRVNAVRDTGLGAALAKTVERFIDRTGLPTEFTADAAAASFGDERAETTFRMAEEALRNVEQHARATRVGVSLQVRHGTQLELRIEDNGVGFDPHDPHPGHFGLVGLREQAQLIGADLRIESAPNRGTTLTLSLRMAPEVL